MRRFFSSWTTVFAQLGFKRKRVKKRRRCQTRNARLEPLEERRMLAASTPDEEYFSETVAAAALGLPPGSERLLPQYVLANQDRLPSDQFDVRTEYDQAGSPRAIISLREDLETVDDTLHEMHLELRVGETVLQRQTVLIDIESAAFRQAFLDERVNRARNQLTAANRQQIDVWREQLAIGSLTNDEFLAQQSLAGEAIEGLESALLPNNLVSSAYKIETYAQIDERAADAKLQLLTASDPTSREAAQAVIDQFGRTALLLADYISTDLSSNDPLVAAAAGSLRDEIAVLSDRSFTMFAGLGIDHIVSQTVTEGGSREFLLAFVETGEIAPNPHLRIDLGSHQAMVQATLQHSSAGAGAAGFALTEVIVVVVDTHVAEQQSSTNYGSDPLLTVQGSSANGGTQVGLLRVDLATLVSNGEVPAEALLDLWNTTTDSDATHSISAHWDTWGAASAYSWDEAAVVWNDYSTSLASGFTAPLDTWDVSTDANQADVTEAVQRALLFGDSNQSGSLDHTNAYGRSLGDIEAFYTAVRFWTDYVAQNAPNELVANGLIYRNDANWDGLVNGVTGRAFSAATALRKGILT